MNESNLTTLWQSIGYISADDPEICTNSDDVKTWPNKPYPLALIAKSITVSL